MGRIIDENYEPVYCDALEDEHEYVGKKLDLVEVVRCKDCKYYGRVDKRRFYRGSDCLNNHIDTIVPDRDYCSRGERRENG